MALATCQALLVELGDALRLLRLRKNLSKVACQRLSGLHRNHIRDWERGSAEPPIGSLVRHLDSLGCDLHDLQEALDRIRRLGSKPQG